MAHGTKRHPEPEASSPAVADFSHGLERFLAHHRRRYPSRQRLREHQRKRLVRKRLRRLRNASDVFFDDIRDCLRQWHCDGAKGRSR